MTGSRTLHAGAPSRDGARWVAAATGTLLAAMALAACGDDEPADRTAPPPAGKEQTPRDGHEPEPSSAEDGPTTAGEPDEGETEGGEPSGEEGDGGDGCTFQAPPGRLAEDEIVVEAVGVGCDQARSLARAISLGQPAGANLVIEKDGFECEPSTRARGANVTYNCTSGSAEVSFDVVWSP